MIKAIAFDVDGTLFSSHLLIGKVYAKTIKKINEEHHLHLKIPTLEEITPHIGKPSETIYKELFPTLDSSYYPLIKETNGSFFSTLIKEEGGEIIPGVIQMFEELSKLNMMLLLASNAGLPYLNAFTEKYNLPVTKPIIALNYTNLFVKGDILGEYLKIHDLQSNEIIMVGDRIMDLEAADVHHIPFIGISIEEYGKSHELIKAPYVVRSIGELTSLIKKLVGENKD